MFWAPALFARRSANVADTRPACADESPPALTVGIYLKYGQSDRGVISHVL